MSRNIIKILEKNFSDLKAGQKMLISSPEKIAEYIKNIPEGIHKTSKEMRLDLAKVMGGIILVQSQQESSSGKQLKNMGKRFLFGD